MCILDRASWIGSSDELRVKAHQVSPAHKELRLKMRIRGEKTMALAIETTPNQCRKNGVKANFTCCMRKDDVVVVIEFLHFLPSVQMKTI